MLHLLKIEWLKVKNYRTFWIIFILFLVAIIGANYITYEFQQLIFGEKARKDPNSEVIKLFLGSPPYAFPQVWQMASQATSYLLIIPGLLTIILFTNEYSYKTHRQNIIDGFNRNQFITSRLLPIVVMAAISTIMVGVTALIFGYTGSKPFSFEKIEYLLYSFIQFLSYCLCALMFSVLFKRSGITIGVYFLYVVVIELVIFFLFRAYEYNYGYYLPIESADSLISAPVFENAQKSLFAKPDFIYRLSACLFYLAVYITVSYKKFNKDDL